MSIEQIQQTNSQLADNIEKLQAYIDLLIMTCSAQAKAQRSIATPNLLQQTLHQQLLEKIKRIHEEMEPHLCLLVATEKLLREARESYQAWCVGAELSDDESEDFLSLIDLNAEVIAELRDSLSFAINKASGWNAYDLIEAYPEYSPEFSKKRNAESAELMPANILHVYNNSNKRQRQDTLDVDLTCNEELGDDALNVTYKK
ncbi:MAG: hypothetical protein ABSF18_03925 [Gammaproteobacteria bacterium]|jgi:hypothetical protein